MLKIKTKYLYIEKKKTFHHGFSKTLVGKSIKIWCFKRVEFSLQNVIGKRSELNTKVFI